jgi:hypothetical protein
MDEFGVHQYETCGAVVFANEWKEIMRIDAYVATNTDEGLHDGIETEIGGRQEYNGIYLHQ